MKPDPIPTMPPASLPADCQEILRSRWTAYVAAGAAALGAGIGTAEGAINFVDFNDIIVSDTNTADGNFTVVPLAINGDAAIDIRLGHRIANGTPAAIVAAPAGGALAVVGVAASGFNYPSRLLFGASIGPSALLLNLGNGLGSLAYGNGFPNSKWAAAGGSTGYLGFRFDVSGQSHFGWLRLTVSGTGGASPRSITVHDAGYEDTPDAPIMMGAVPEGTSLGLLALGSAGLLAHRRRRALAVAD